MAFIICQIINIFLTVLLIIYICIVKIQNILNLFGFSTSGIVVWILALYISFKFRKYSIAILLFLLSIISLIGFNHFVYYITYSPKLSSWFLVILIITYLLLPYLGSFPCSATSLLRPPSECKQEEQKAFIQLSSFSYIFLMLSTFFSIATVISLTMEYKVSCIVYPYIFIIFATISGIIINILIKKISDEEVAYFFDESLPKIAINNPLSKLIIGYIIFIIIGSICEIFRGFWLFWIENIILISVLLIANWKIWKHIFIPEKVIEKKFIMPLPIPDVSKHKFYGKFFLIFISYLFFIGIICIFLPIKKILLLPSEKINLEIPILHRINDISLIIGGLCILIFNKKLFHLASKSQNKILHTIFGSRVGRFIISFIGIGFVFWGILSFFGLM